MQNDREYINLLSKKIKLIGLTEEALNILGKWYNNEKHITTKINEFHKIKGKTNFEKLLEKIKIFPRNLKIEIIKEEEYNNGFSFKCKDIHGKNILIHFFSGGTYSGSAPHLTIVTPDKIKDFNISYIHIFKTFVPSIKQEYIIGPDREKTLRNEYNKIYTIKTDNKENSSNTINKESATKKENNAKEKKDFLTKEIVDKFYSNETEVIEEEKGLIK